MKRTQDNMSLEGPTELISNKREMIPFSGGYSETPKRIRNNDFLPKPSIITAQETLPKRTTRLPADFTRVNPFLRVFSPFSDISDSLEINDLIRFNEHRPLLILFFGLVNEELLDNMNSIYEVLKTSYGVEIVGISRNITRNDYKFPLIEDCGSNLSKLFSTLDPLGGGIYPLDTLILFDRNGECVFQIPIGVVHQQKCNRPINLANLNKMLFECLKYLKHFTRNT